jgi:hypothetical protein
VRVSVDPALVATTAEAWLGGRAGITVIAKLTLELAAEQKATLTAPVPLVPADHTWGGHPLRSVEAPSDLAPFPCVPEVVLRGHAVPPAGGSPTSMTVRVAMFRGSAASIDKTALIEGDRSSPDAPPRPIVRVPLTWERAVGGLDRPDNPLGSDRPNVLDPHDRTRPIGFGPIAATSRGRRGLLQGKHEHPTREPGRYPADFPLEYFQCAPLDQRLPSGFAAGDWLVLLGLSPRGLVRTELPALRPMARLVTSRATLERPLVADLAVVDADRGMLTLTHRARFDLDEGETVHTVQVALERDGVVSYEGLATVAPSGGPGRDAPLDGTLAVGEGTVAVTGPAPRAEAPFPLTGPGGAHDRSGAIAPPWLFATKAPEAAGEATLSLAAPSEAQPSGPGRADLGPERSDAWPLAPAPRVEASLAAPAVAGTDPAPPLAAREVPRPGPDGWASAADLLAALTLPPR